MKIEILEDGDEKLKIKVDTDLTVMNLLNERIWQQKVDASAYKADYPYLSKPILMVRAKNPKKAIVDAAGQIVEEVKDFRKHFAAAVK